MHELRDLNNVAEEEIDSISIPAVIDVENGLIVFNESDFVVEDGIMFFERPLKTKLSYLNVSTLDRMSIITSFLKEYIYVFAISVEEKYNENLIEFSKAQKSDSKHYIFFVSWSREDVNSID